MSQMDGQDSTNLRDQQGAYDEAVGLGWQQEGEIHPK